MAGFSEVSELQYKFWTETSNFLKRDQILYPDGSSLPAELLINFWDMYKSPKIYGIPEDDAYLSVSDHAGNEIYVGSFIEFCDKFDPDDKLGLVGFTDGASIPDSAKAKPYIKWGQFIDDVFWKSSFDADYFDPMKLKFFYACDDLWDNGDLVGKVTYDGTPLNSYEWDQDDHDIRFDFVKK